MGLTGLAEIVKAVGMVMTGELTYAFQRVCPPPRSNRNPAHEMNHERGLHFLGCNGPVLGFCVAGGMFIYPRARLPVSRALRGMRQYRAKTKAYETQCCTW